MTADEIMRLLDRKYRIEQRSAFLPEVSVLDSFVEQSTKRRRRNHPKLRRIDALVVSNRRGTTHLLALEVKVSRPDFKRDTLEKRAAWLAHADQFAYVVPAGMVDPSEVPDGCGLLEARGHSVTWRINAPNTPPEPLPDNFLRYLAYRCSDLTATVRLLDQARNDRLAGQLVPFTAPECLL